MSPVIENACAGRLRISIEKSSDGVRAIIASPATKGRQHRMARIQRPLAAILGICMCLYYYTTKLIYIKIQESVYEQG